MKSLLDKGLQRVALLVPLALGGLCLVAAMARADDLPEQDSLEIMSALVDGDLHAARTRAERVSRAHPDFRTAQTLLADLRAIELGLDPRQLELPDAGEFSVDDWRTEARVRWQHHLEGHSDGLPAALLRLSERFRVAIVADMGSSRMFVFENVDGVPRRIADYYMGIGRAGYLKTTEGDLRTPLGVYHVTRWIDDAQLPDLYGAGAFPVNYPNAWDRANARTGHGIWIHGVPRAQYSRPPYSSEGCVTVSNDQIEELRALIDVGHTPVVAVERIRWLQREQWLELQAELVAQIDAWRLAWQTGDPAWHARYAPDFRNERHDRASWLANRRQFEAGARQVSVDVRDLALMRYEHGDDELWQASFVQHYVSGDLDSEVRKEQLWRRSESGWEIVYEDISDS